MKYVTMDLKTSRKLYYAIFIAIAKNTLYGSIFFYDKK